MKHSTLLALVPALLMAVNAHAVVLQYSGNIYEVANAQGERIGSTVDHINFSVGSASEVCFDVLSWEYDFNTSSHVDVNGDGEIAFFDPYIHLFRDDGALDSGDWVASNDDSMSTYGDGSVSSLDSYLSRPLAAGDYVLAVGSFYLSRDEAIAGFNADIDYPISDLEEWTYSDHGDYRVTFCGDVTACGSDPVVPEPATLALVGLGLSSAGLLQRRRWAARR